jgi:heme/copper-type cytochrome/quinol oxidase subunit 3
LAEGHTGRRIVKEIAALDVSRLPLHGMRQASATWWGTLAFMLLEGTGFALVIAMDLYLASIARSWPPAPPPDLIPGSIVTVILLASVPLNLALSGWAERQELVKVRWGTAAMCVLGLLPLIVRVFEFPALHVSWDSNAYGSILWTMLGLHTTHLITDLGDSIVLAVLMFTRHGDNKRRFGDVQDNTMYWNFVVLTWLPIYVCIYWVPRL